MKFLQPPSCYGPQRISGSISSLLPQKRVIDALARKTGLMKRVPKKVSPILLVRSVLTCVAEAAPCLRAIATEVGIQGDCTLARQSLWERISTPNAVAFFKACVGAALKKSEVFGFPIAGLGAVERILLGDSSAVKLHHSLNQAFPGGSNQNKQSAQLRLQCTLDLLSGQWVAGGFEPYLRQDATAAPDLLETSVKPGDLVIRDLGYAVINVFKAIAVRGAFFLSRLQTQWNCYSQSGEKLDLLKVLKKHAGTAGDRVRLRIRVGQRQQMPCELIALRVPTAVANARRRRANQNAKRKGVTHTKRYLRLQNWTLLVTNLGEENATIDQICELYRLRWRIEMFFKMCKSHTSLRTLARHRTNPYHAEVMLWSWMLLMIRLSQSGAFAMARYRWERPCSEIGNDNPPPAHPWKLSIVHRSLFKSMPHLLRHIACQLRYASIPIPNQYVERLIRQTEYHDQCDQRLSRLSLPQRLENLLPIPS